MRYYQQVGIRVVVLDLPTTMISINEKNSWVLDRISNILIEVISSIAEQERMTIRARQAEGIVVMPVCNGKSYGRKTFAIQADPRQHIPIIGTRYMINGSQRKLRRQRQCKF